MFPTAASLVSLVFAASAVVAAPTYRRTDVPHRADWKNQNLESYYRFRTRYKNLGCADIQGTEFYDQCCLPLSKGESPAEQCTPSWCSAVTTSSPVSVEVPATSSVSTATTSSVVPVDAPAVTTTLASSSISSPVPTPVEDEDEGDDEGDDDDDYDWVCDDDDEATTSIDATTTSTSTSAPAPTVTEIDDGTEDDGDYDDDEEDDDIPYCDEVGDDYEPITTTTTSSPEATTTPAPAPETTTEQAPATTTEQAPATTTAAQDNNTGNADVQTGGFATFYYQGGNAGACGEKHGDDEFIGAIDQSRYGYNFGVVSSECGRRVRITNTKNGKTVDITIKDVCPTCVNGNSIDLSKGAFLAIAEEADGMVPINWVYL